MAPMLTKHKEVMVHLRVRRYEEHPQLLHIVQGRHAAVPPSSHAVQIPNQDFSMHGHCMELAKPCNGFQGLIIGAAIQQ